MPQFDVYPNPHAASRTSVPFVVDVQSGLIDALPTRLVMPLSRVGATQARLPQGLCPLIEVDGEPLALMPHLAAPLDKRLLRQPILSIAHRAHEVGTALDAVTSGI
ncbi:CcdB family protein [Castellaniella sp.]|jgi:toxin CcdB|uniref:CcdB family protein n=1 Tax=Castellaniella sp. TaxID=1955812 RepID=UPI003C763AD9